MKCTVAENNGSDNTYHDNKNPNESFIANAMELRLYCTNPWIYTKAL